MYSKIIKYLYYISITIFVGAVGFTYYSKTQSLSADEFSSQGLSQYMDKFYPWAISVCSGLAIIMLIYSGYLYVTSAGNVEQVNKAKEFIVGALSGLALLVLASLVFKTLASPVG